LVKYISELGSGYVLFNGVMSVASILTATAILTVAILTVAAILVLIRVKYIN